MRLICRYILIFVLTLLSYSCGDDKVNFKIDGTIAGGETLTLRLTYYDGEKIVSQQIGARDGKFEIQGKVPGPTILELSGYDGSLITNLYVDKKSDFKVRIDVNNRTQMQVWDNDINSRYAAFISENAEAIHSGDMAKLNKAVEKYIKENPQDIASTLLLLTLYDASGDDNQSYQLYETIAEDAKPVTLVEPFTTLAARLWDQEGGVLIPEFDLVMLYDSIFHFDPKEKALNLLTFSTSNRSNERKDSILDSLRSLHKTNKNIRIIDIAIESDTISWKRYNRNDSAKWEQAWMPGGLSARGLEQFSLPSIPYFIIVDSTGVQQLRTNSLSRAIDSVRVLESKAIKAEKARKEAEKAKEEAQKEEEKKAEDTSKSSKDKADKAPSKTKASSSPTKR